MIALFIGVLLILFAVYAVLPFPWALGWWPDVVQFLKGGVPLIACGTLDAAVAEARIRAHPGDTVLLAPACARSGPDIPSEKPG